MPHVKSFSVGDGDMYYIKHASPNFTIIDCFLSPDNRETIVDELKREAQGKEISRFISTHPDEDHIKGIEYLDQRMPIVNFYCVENEATKPEPSTSFIKYCELRDSRKAFYVKKGCERKWMNVSSEERNAAGINILWPDIANEEYKAALADAADGYAYNNMSLIVRYTTASISFLWLGDLETEFMENIIDDVDLRKTNIVFAPHHGRKSGKIPDSWLDKLQPEIIVIGEAPSRHLHYYSGYNTITQSRAGDIVFDCSVNKECDIYCSNENYELDYLVDMGRDRFLYYKGTLLT